MKFIIIITITVFSSFYSHAQKASIIVPEKLIWIADGQELNLDQAQKGILMPGKLEIEVSLNSQQRKLIGQKFEFRWYRRGATQDYLTNTFIMKAVQKYLSGNNYVFKVGRTNLKKGWWKVRIEAIYDKKLLSFHNKQEFWILLR